MTVTKGGNRKGIPLTRDFFAVVFSFTGFGFLWAKQSRNPPLWQRQRKENSSCGNCGKTRSGVVRVIEVLEIVGVVDGSGNYLNKKIAGRVRGRAQRLPRNANQV